MEQVSELEREEAERIVIGVISETDDEDSSEEGCDSQREEAGRFGADGFGNISGCRVTVGGG